MTTNHRTRRTRNSHERAIALVTVLVVLLALIAIATPFAMSMRNHERATAVLAEQTRASQSLRSALAAAEAAIAQTDPANDPTPQVDSLSEFDIDLGSAYERFGQSANDPAGTIASVRATDEQGKVDLNACSPFLLANLLRPMRLVGEIEADQDKEITVSSTEGMPDSGLLWIDGEIILYRAKTNRTFTDLKRGFSTALLKSLPPSVHASYRPVVDYRVITATVYPYKIASESYSGFASVSALKDIARFGEVGFTADDIDALEEELTTYAGRPEGVRFGPELRAFGTYGAGDHPLPIVLSGGRNLNAGTVVRLRNGKTVEYNLIARCENQGKDRVAVTLQEPPANDYPADSLLVAPLLRSPININTCSRRVLEALIFNLKGPGMNVGIDADLTKLLVDRILKARPIQGEPGFGRLLNELRKDQAFVDTLGYAVARTILMNALNALDSKLDVSTSPFTYKSLGTVTLETAVSENLIAGREASRAFARAVVDAAAGGQRQALFQSQIDFYDSARLNRSGLGWATFPIDLSEYDDGNEPPLPLSRYLDQGRFVPLTSEEELAIGRDAAARARPVQKLGLRDATAEGAPRVLHCDDPIVVTKKPGSDEKPLVEDPEGWNVADRGPLTIDVTDPMVSLIGSNDYVQPFCFEMWWLPGTAGSESYLFDTGENELSNRALAYFDGAKLVFRVADTTVPDFGSTAENGLTTMAEIRYAFDDGLDFDPTVPYHLSFYARGSKPTDLALFVDGVPRGKRAFITQTTKSVGPVQQAGGPFSNIAGYNANQGETISVLDTELFPDFGVLRIGDELFEYTGKTKDKFSVSGVPGQPFGGRARRGTFADPPQTIVKQGNTQATKEIHPERSIVELYGYAALIAQKRVPNGDSQLSDPLGAFAVAMVDPNAEEAKQKIEVNRPQGGPPLQVGTGLPATAVRIPITGLGKPAVSSSSSSGSSGSSSSSNQLSSAFSKNGGFALVVSSPTPPPSVAQASVTVPGQPGQGPQQQTITFGWNVDRDTPNGKLGRIEMVYYSSFDGTALTGVTRSGGSMLTGVKWQPQSNLSASTGGGNGQGNNNNNQQSVGAEIANVGHDHVLQWANGILPPAAAKLHDVAQPIYVIPISIKVAQTIDSSGNDWAIPEVGGRGGNGATMPEMIQIGLGFDGGAGNAGANGGTEWIRYDVVANGCFVRDNPERLSRAGELVGHYLTALYTLKDGTPPSAQIVARAVNFEDINANQKEKEEILSALTGASNVTGLDNIEGLLSQGVGALAFRGVLGTGAKNHPAGERVLPVFRTYRGPDPDWGRPGAKDFITIIDPKNGAREEHTINFGYCEPDVERWRQRACHVALDAGVKSSVVGDFADMMFQINAEDPEAGWKELANQMLESRQVARMLKFPSGELPQVVGKDISFGGDLRGTPSPAGDTFDEIEFFTPLTPDPGFRSHHFLLEYFDDRAGEVWIPAHVLRDPSRRKTGPAIEALDPISKLPQDGVVLQIGEELVACKSVRYENATSGRSTITFAVFQIAEGGRGFLGTPMHYHARNEGVRELTWLRVSLLERDLDDTGHLISLKDTSDFEDQGVVLIGHELLVYTRKQGTNQLYMPTYRPDGTSREVGLFRGSYGTPRERHDAETLVVQFPARYLDRYRPGADVPELAYLGLDVPARRGVFKELSWKAEGESKKTRLVVEARVGGRDSFGDLPSQSLDRFTFSEVGSTGIQEKHSILRQGDILELRLFTEYLENAFDSRAVDPDPEGFDRGGANDWKRAPRVKILGVEWIGTPSRRSYEEWR